MKKEGIFMKVLNFGSLNLDYVYQVESILISRRDSGIKRQEDILRR